MGEADAELADPSSSSEADSFESSAVLLSSSCPLWLALFEAEFVLLAGSGTGAEGWAGTDGTTGTDADRNGALKRSSSASSIGRSSSAISSCSSDDTMADSMLPASSGGSGIRGIALGTVADAALGNGAAAVA